MIGLLPFTDGVELPRLTPRESDVILAGLRYHNVAEIAEHLHIEVHTVRFHLENVRMKAGGRDQGILWWWTFFFALGQETQRILNAQPVSTPK